PAAKLRPRPRARSRPTPPVAALMISPPPPATPPSRLPMRPMRTTTRQSHSPISLNHQPSTHNDLANDNDNNNTAEGEQWTGTNLAGDVVEQGIKRNKPEYQDDLRWFWRWSTEAGLSQTESARDLGIDAGTYSKVLRGEYRNAGGLILP